MLRFKLHQNRTTKSNFIHTFSLQNLQTYSLKMQQFYFPNF